MTVSPLHDGGTAPQRCSEARAGPTASNRPLIGSFDQLGDGRTKGIRLGRRWVSVGPLEYFASVGLGEAGIRVVGSEPVRGAIIDESLVQQPLDGSALGSSVTKGVPRRNQFGVVVVDLLLESSERSRSLQRP
jgi:hypothetical protein